MSILFLLLSGVSAQKCLCFGPGILNGGASGTETMFVIQAASSDGKFRDTGGDEFIISIKNIESEVRVPFDLSDGDDLHHDRIDFIRKHVTLNRSLHNSIHCF